MFSVDIGLYPRNQYGKLECDHFPGQKEIY